MIYGSIQHSSTHAPLETLEIYREAIDWLRGLTAASPLGLRERHDGKMSLNVHTYATKPRSECRFENHRRTVDIQYTITGGECVEWSLVGDLEPDGDYLPDREKQYFCLPALPGPVTLWMPPGFLAVFHADDAHCPKIADGQNGEVLKAVVKIDASLLE